MNESPSSEPEATPDPKKLWLDAGGPLPAAILEAFRRIVAYADEQARRGERAPKKAIHEFRKSIRRARALLKLLRGFLPAAEYRALSNDLRRAVRQTSALRDVDVLLDHVSGLEAAEDEQEVQRALIGHLEQRRARQADGQSADALREGATRVRPLPGRLGTCLPLSVDQRDLRGALKASYRRVRNAARLALADPTHEEAFHDLRKRVKELRYQLELLRPQSISAEPLHALAKLAEGLGEVTDLFVLRSYIRAHRQDLGACSPEPLLARIDAEATAKTARVLALVEEELSRKGKAYVQAVLGS